MGLYMGLYSKNNKQEDETYFVLDISDFKESHEHKLLHLVWRKFPRNYRPPTDGQKTTISDSTQTDVESRADRHKISENSIIPDDTNCRSATENGPFDIRETSDLDKSASTSDSGSTEFSYTKGQSSKLRNPEKKSPIQLSNRFDCLEDEKCSESTHGGSGSSDCESSVSSRERLHRGSPKTFKRETNSIASKISPKSELFSFTDAVEHRSNISSSKGPFVN